jgi:predicted metal-binding membrane protein
VLPTHQITDTGHVSGQVQAGSQALAKGFTLARKYLRNGHQAGRRRHFERRLTLVTSATPLFAGGLLIGVGLFQCTPWKQRLLTHCAGPLQFLVSAWCEGSAGHLQILSYDEFAGISKIKMARRCASSACSG